MKLYEKIQHLRKENGLTQEQLAELCGVSRQAITKWEADIAIPETEKLLFMSRYFRVSLDELLKDELEIHGVKEVSCCGMITMTSSNQALYEGILIKESIEDENILDFMDIKKVELWKTSGNPKYWTAIYFSSNNDKFPEEVAKVMKHDEQNNVNWFVDFKADKIKYIVFNNLVLSYTIGNQAEKQMVCDKCRELGIPDSQMKWSD